MAMAGSDMTVDDVYHKLRLSFPFIHIRREDARDTPELAQLLLSLAKRVDETGLSRSVAAELQSERTKLAQQLDGYHSVRLLHAQLEDMAIGPRDDSSADQKLSSAVQECLSLAELAASLPLAPPSADGQPGEHTLLQLTADELTPSAEHRQTLARLPRALDQRLTRLAHRYTAIVHPDRDDSDDVIEQLELLPTQLEELLRCRDEQEQQLQQLLERRDAQLLQQSQLMGQQLTMMLTLINKHKLEHKVDLERKTIDHLTNNIEGMLLKIRLLQLHIQCDTYTEQCLAALRATDRHVRAESSRQEVNLNSAKQQLAAYQSAGSEFAALAQRYRQLCQEVEHQHWLIAEMDALGSGDASAADAQQPN